MGRVQDFIKDGDITDNDYLLGSNGESGGKTSSYYIRDLKKIFGLDPATTIGDITGLQDALDGKVDDPQVLTDVPENALFTDTVYTLPFDNNSVNWDAAHGWGDHANRYSLLLHTHPISEIASLQAALDAKVEQNPSITPSTQIKITYDADGLVLSGASATTLDIPDSEDRRYVTDAEKAAIGSGGSNAFDISIATGTGSPTIDQLQQYIDNTGSSGFFLGGTLTDGGAGTLDVSEGSGFIRKTNNSNAELQSFKWSASTGIAVTDNTTQYVYVDDDGVISLSTDEFLETPDLIQIGAVTKESGSIISTFSLGVRLDESIGQAGRFIRRVHGISRDNRKGGLIMGQSEDANRTVSVTNGILWWGRTEYPFANFDTSGADTFETYSANGQEDAVATDWDNLQYDNSGTLTTLTNNRWSNRFFYIIPDNGVIMVYGRSQFTSQALAEEEGVPSSSLPTKITETGLLIARFTFQKSSNTAIVKSAFEALFANASVTDHGDLAGLANDDHTQYVLVDGTRNPSNLTITADSGVTILQLDSSAGTYYDMTSANNSATYTFQNQVIGGLAKVLFNSLTEPVIDSAFNIGNDPFVPNMNMYMTAWYNGNRVEYWFTRIDSPVVLNQSLLFLSTPVDRQEIDGLGTVALSAISESATSIEFFYKDISDTWISIGLATETGEGTGIFEKNDWTPSVMLTAVKAVADYADATTQEVINRINGISIYDTFTDTNGTLLSAHTPDSSLGGGWVIGSGDWEIQNNELDINTVDSNLHVVLHDLGKNEAIMRFKVSQTPSPNANHQVVLRYVDSDNYLRVNIDTGGGNIKVNSFTGGSASILYNGGGFNLIGNDVEIRLIDNIFNVKVFHSTLQYTDPFEVALHETGTRFGIARPGLDSDYHYDFMKIIPVTPPILNTDVSYTGVKNGSSILTKNSYPPNDNNGISSPNFYKIGSTNYMTFTAVNSSGKGVLMYATAPDSDPHNWTRNSAVAFEDPSRSVWDCTSYWDGVNLYILYTDITEGKIYYAKGVDINNLTAKGLLVDLTGQNVYTRHPDIRFFNGKFYLYIDSRTDHSGGRFGDVIVGSGPTIESISNFTTALSSSGFAYEASDVGAPSVRYNSTNEYYEMLFSGYIGGGEPFFHETGLAISRQPDGKFVRVSESPVIPAGTIGEFDYVISTPEWYLDLDVAYYTAKANGGSKDGFAYTTLSP